jgi:hypothetical protein
MSDNNACWWPLINPAGAMANEHPVATEVNDSVLVASVKKPTIGSRQFVKFGSWLCVKRV